MPIIQPQVITPLPTPPNPADRSTFNSRAYPWSLALEPWTTQANQLAADTLQNATWAQTKASESQSSATGSANSATAANNAKTAAETAKTAAETARNGAQSSATAAAGSAAAANTAKTGAEDARNSAAASATDAAQSAAEAAQSASGAIAPSIHAATAKTTPADADEIPIVDSAASWSLKKLTWGNLKATIWAAFKTIATGSSAKATLGLGTAATKDVGTADGNVMQVEAFGLGATTALPTDIIQPGDQATAQTTTFFQSDADKQPPAWGGTENVGGWVVNRGSRPIAFFFGNRAELKMSYGGAAGWLAPVDFIHTGNILTATGQSTQYPMTQKATTDAINARGFADASGVLTVTSGALSNDMSNFLSSMTFDEMSSKIGGGGEVDFTTLADNATALTPVPGKAYWLTRTGTTAITTTLTCTHAPGKIRTWHVIVSKGTGANDAFIPNFSVSGLTETSVHWSGGGTIKPTISGVSHVMIMFMQIDQSVRATIVDGW